MESEEWRVGSSQRQVPRPGKHPVTWLHSIFYEHGCTGYTGLTGREVPAPEAGWGDGPVRGCGCPGLRASRFLKKSCASCSSMSINLLGLEADTRSWESQGVISCPWWTIPQPVSLHPSPGGVSIEWVKNTVFLRVSSWIALFFCCFRPAGPAAPPGGGGCVRFHPGLPGRQFRPAGSRCG